MFPIYKPYPDYQPQRPHLYHHPPYMSFAPCNTGQMMSTPNGLCKTSAQCGGYNDYMHSYGYPYLCPQPQLMFPPPPPYWFHYPPFPQQLPPHLGCPSQHSNYIVDHEHCEYDKKNTGHCCGLQSQECMKGQNNVKVAEEQVDADKGLYEFPNPWNYPYPVVWIPPGWKNNNENLRGSLKDSTAFDWLPVEKAKGNVRNCDIEKKERPEEMENHVVTDLQNPPPIVSAPIVHTTRKGTLETSERDLKRRRDRNDENGSMDNETHEHLPHVWMISNNKYGEKGKKSNDPYDSGVKTEPVKLKVIPVKVPEEYNSSDNKVVAKNSDNSVHTTSSREEGRPKDKIAKGVEDIKGDQRLKAKNPQKHSESSQNKLPPVCLRVDPLRSKKRSDISRSPSPPGEKENESVQNSPVKMQSVDEKPEAGDTRKETKVFAVVDKNVKQEPINIIVEKVNKTVSGDSDTVGKNVAPMEKKVRNEPPKRFTTEGEAALHIQSVYRGFLVRKWKPLEKLRRIKKVQENVYEIMENIRNLEVSSKLDANQRQISVVGETVMRLLLELDTIQVGEVSSKLDANQRQISVVGETVMRLLLELDTIQEKLDALITIPADKSHEEAVKQTHVEHTASTNEMGMPALEDAGPSYLEVPSHFLVQEDGDTTSKCRWSASSSTDTTGIGEGSASTFVSEDDLLPIEVCMTSESDATGMETSVSSSTGTMGIEINSSSSMPVSIDSCGMVCEDKQEVKLDPKETEMVDANESLEANQEFGQLDPKESELVDANESLEANHEYTQLESKGRETMDANESLEAFHGSRDNAETLPLFNESSLHGTTKIFLEHIAPVVSECQAPQVSTMNYEEIPELDAVNGATEIEKTALGGGEEPNQDFLLSGLHDDASKDKFEIDASGLVNVHESVSDGQINQCSHTFSKENFVNKGYEIGLDALGGDGHGGDDLMMKKGSMDGEEAVIIGQTKTDDLGSMKHSDLELPGNFCPEDQKIMPRDAIVGQRGGDNVVRSTVAENVSGLGNHRLEDLVDMLMKESKKQLNVIQELNERVRDLEVRLKREKSFRRPTGRPNLKSRTSLFADRKALKKGHRGIL